MPRYFFDLKSSHRLLDPAGLDCSGDDEAFATAKVIAIRISQETSGAGGQRHIAIMDGAGKEIGKIPVHRELKSAAEQTSQIRVGLFESHPLPRAGRRPAADLGLLRAKPSPAYTYGKALKFCARCYNCRWVCEAHPDRPWLGPKECGCGAAGALCPICNQTDEDTLPEMPDGFEMDR